MAKLIRKVSTTNANAAGWDRLHNQAVNSVVQTIGRAHETSLVLMLKGLAQYAKDHHTRLESPIGKDYVLGPAFKDIADGLRTLLNGETGRLDCGTVDAFILDTLTENGFPED